MRVTFLGTTTLVFDDGATQLMVDAHVTRPSLARVALGRIDSNEPLVRRVVDEEGLDRVRGILASHSHHDHVLDLGSFARLTGADVYGSASTLNVARGSGVSESRLHRFGDGDELAIGGFRVRVLRSVHTKPGPFNNNLGEEIAEPLRLPARMGAFKEGGSFDFLIRGTDSSALVRASCNYLPGELDGIVADTLFLGVTNLSRQPREWRESFFLQTIDKVHPRTVIPIHWDNFFRPLHRPVRGLPADDWRQSLQMVGERCAERQTGCLVMAPLDHVDL